MRTDFCTTPCLPVSEFADLINNWTLRSNFTVIFLPGKHYHTVNLSVSNFTHYSMISERVTAQIVCKGYSSIHFSHSQHVSISNLNFSGCGGNQVEYVDEFIIKDSVFSGQIKFESTMSSGTTSTFEIFATAALIINSAFSNYNGRRYFYGRNGFAGSLRGITAVDCEININQSTFTNNEAEHGGAIFAQNKSTILIHNSAFTTNYAGDGGAIFSSGSNITVVESELDMNRAENGMVLYSLESTVTIKSCKFAGNAGSSFFGDGVLYSLRSTITIESSKFEHSVIDRIYNGGAILFSLESTVIIRGSKLNGNTAKGSENGIIYSSRSSIVMEKMNLRIILLLRQQVELKVECYFLQRVVSL